MSEVSFKEFIGALSPGFKRDNELLLSVSWAKEAQEKKIIKNDYLRLH